MQVIRQRLDAIHIEQPAALTVWATLPERLRLKPPDLITHLTLIVDVVVDR